MKRKWPKLTSDISSKGQFEGIRLVACKDAGDDGGVYHCTNIGECYECAFDNKESLMKALYEELTGEEYME